MRRVFSIGILILVCFLVQTTLFSFHDLCGIAPNLLLILTMSFGIMRGRKEGLLTGFFCGLLFDLFYSSLIGPYMLVFMWIGYFNGLFHRNYLMEDVLFPVIIIAIDEVIFHSCIYVISFLIRSRTNIGYYIIHVMLPQLLYSVLATVIIYRVFLRINRYLKKKSKKQKV